MLQFTYNFWTSAYPNFNKTLMLLLTSADYLLVSHTDAERTAHQQRSSDAFFTCVRCHKGVVSKLTAFEIQV
jgi:cytochrome c peroxidase